ncbi:MAG: hypothetical protein HC819_10900 [Cyclobacteriaceae bacterium]|nr:hypothetical protein [Cyclobacteriaceae bacterium]
MGQNIETLCRMSPYAHYTAGNLRLGLEVEYTSATYGSNHDLNWKPQQTQLVENYRLLCSVYYFF